MPQIVVKLKDRSYPVIIGSGRIESLDALLKKHIPGGGRVFVFYDARFYALHGTSVKKALKLSRARTFELVLPPGERTKSLAQAKKLYDILLDRKITRSDLILACGGGVVCDLVGFVAATLLRGIPWANVPTTLLAMVDAAVGGKTAVNHKHGKNLIGAFWQPKFVLCDPLFLNTLPPRQMVCGLGEIIKYAGLTGNKILTPLKKYLEQGNMYHERLLIRMVEAGVTCKACLVSEDERDEGKRRFLNFGHTFAHAIEKSAGYGRLLHGEAVILGVAAAITAGILRNPQCERYFGEYRTLAFEMIKLVPRCHLEPDKIVKAMAWDKKRGAGGDRLVLLSRPGRPFITNDLDKKIIIKALRTVLSIYNTGGGLDE
jgi:3-dehydroquinate synthase